MPASMALALWLPDSESDHVRGILSCHWGPGSHVLSAPLCS